MSNLDYSKKLIELGDIEGAVSELKNIVREDSANVEAWILLGQNVEDELQAKYCFEQALLHNPGNIIAINFLNRNRANSENIHTEIKKTDREHPKGTSLEKNRLGAKAKPKNLYPLGIFIAVLVICIFGAGFVTIWVIANNNLYPFVQPTATQPIIITILPTLDSKLIKGKAISYIPRIGEMPTGYSEDPTSGPLPYANADGYSQIYKNPDFIQLDREVFVGYFTFICNSSEDASRIFTEFTNEIVNSSQSKSKEVEKVSEERLTKLDSAQTIYLVSTTPSGNYNMSYITGIRYSNFINLVLISAPTDDVNSERASVIKQRLREVSYYYTSLVIQKLPIPNELKFSLPEPQYNRVPPTITP